MKHVTFQRTTAGVCAALIAGSAFGQSGAAWGEQSGRTHERPRFMMYASVPFGDVRVERPSFGLRFESAPLRAASMERIPYLDFRFQRQGNTLMLAGVPALHALGLDSSDGPFGSIGSVDDLPTPVKVTGAALIVLGVACATHLICKRHKDNGPAPYTPPTTGTATGN